MPKTRQQKEEQVKNLSEKLSRAKSVVFADYRGLSMQQLSELRNKLSDIHAEFTITKNTLLARALPASSFKFPASSLEGPTAALFIYNDEISPIKILAKALKDAGIGSIKTGFFEGQLQDQETILRLAMLPTKIELLGKLTKVLVAPLQGMVSVLQGNLAKLVYALSEIQKAKGGV